ncbi:MAG: putative Ig domain-containing protein, partial [Poseidonia sp.]
ITIEILDQLPTLSYSPENLTLTKGQSSSDLPLNATITGSGTITSWEINATLPAGLNFGTSNGTIWGIPTVMQTTAVSYTIWANNTGGSTSATINITINDEAPGPFEYIPENNTWTNNSYVNIGPSFINQTSGNGSTWAVSLPNSNLAMVVGDVVYLNGDNWFGNARLAALNTSNGTAWYPNPTWYLENGSVMGVALYNHGYHMAYLIGDVIYFDASGEFWAYNTSNNSGWLVKDINTNTTYPNTNSNPGSLFSTLMGDTIYFSASSGNASLGVELWAHNTSNGTTWRVGHTNTTGTLPSTNAFTSYGRDLGVIDDTIYFQAWGSGDEGMWAYNTSNTTMWQINFRSTSRSANPGKCMAVVVGDTLYFDADGSTHGRELWAHNHANQTTWMVKDLETSNYHHQLRDSSPGCLGMSGVVVGDTFYFSATVRYTDGNGELWAHNTSNHSTWLVADIRSGSPESIPGHYLAVVIGDTIYFDATSYGNGAYYAHRDLWAYDTSNKSTWQVYNFTGAGENIQSDALLLSIGDTLYFVATVNTTNSAGSSYLATGLWAHDTSNQSTWVVEDGSSGYSPYWPGVGQSFFVNGTLYTHISTCTQNCNGLGGYNLLSINYQTNTGGNVTTWAINGSLPSGLSFGTNNGTIYGTPTELWTQTSYMVWANNSGGSSVAYLNITVVDELPTLSYSPSTLVLTINTSSSDLPLNATLTGSGTITSWAISPALPNGLSFGTSNGTIWGTPTSLMTLKTFTIWANNSGGSSSATVNITVNDEAPDISYSPDWFVLTNNTAMSPTATPTNSGGAIPSGIIDSDGNVGEYTSIAIDSNGFKHISYRDVTHSDLAYATDQSGSWVITTVDTANLGKYTSIAIDSNDAVHISYQSNGNLKYATCSNGCTSASNWTNVSVYTSGNVGQYTSIAIDSNDALHVAYWNSSSGNIGFLKYATCSSDCTNTSNWNDVSIATYNSGYGFTSLAIDSNDAVHISYRGINSQWPTVYTNLNYATCSSGCTTASNWDVVSVDTASYRKAYTSLAIDSNDAVHISYGDSNINGGLWYATCSSGCTSGSNWNKVGLDATAAYVGYYNSIAIDANDAVHIAYYRADELKYIALDAS